MDLGDDFAFSFPKDRKCRVCGKVKDLEDGFYKTRKGKGNASSAYSYECKECTITRVSRKKQKIRQVEQSNYPDW
tara:strand:- start:2600 stop:2824 length:225 start_codon:yes stop_codon:yes gene_type:complete